MISDETKRALRLCLAANGFDSSVIDELITERKTLRDEFAMVTLPALIVKSHYYAPDASAQAYEYADSMLKARKTKQGG